MQAWIIQNLWLLGLSCAAYFAAMWFGTIWIVSVFSGWRELAGLYSTHLLPPLHMRSMQSATLRYGMGYHNVLKLGSDRNGIYLGVMLLFRTGHPWLFISWAEIQFEEPKRRFFVMVQTIRLGPNKIPMTLLLSLAEFLRQGQN